MNILYTDKFKRLFRKLPKELQIKALKKENIFKINPFFESLNTHKLKGKLYGEWSFSVDYRYRIIFEFTDKNTALFLLIGDHSIYD